MKIASKDNWNSSSEVQRYERC